MYKILFFIGSFPVYSYGFMASIGIASGFFCLVRYGRSRGFSFNQAVKIGNMMILMGIIGSRLLYVLLNYSDYSNYINNPLSIINIRSGLAWHGAIFGGIAGVYLFSRLEKRSFLDVADLAVLPCVVGHIFGRIGCFLHGCCYGKVSTLPWAVVFPGLGGEPRHPTQIYESLFELLTFFILLKVWKRNKFSGEVFCFFLFLYSIVRFFVEFFRENGNSILLNLSKAQVISICIILFTLWLYKRLSGRPEYAE